MVPGPEFKMLHGWGGMMHWLSSMPQGLFILLTVLWGMCAGFSGAWFFSKPVVAGLFMDIPNQRSSHSIPTPKGGGMGILVAVMVSAVAMNLPLSMGLSFLTVSLLGLVSDRFNVSPVFRLAVHFCTALVVFYCSTSVHVTVTSFSSLFLFCFYAVFWTIFIAASANFYNFMDGINGIASLSAVVCFLLVVLFRVKYAYIDSFTLICLAASGACLGFLPMNFPKARVFMGDVGSILLGFLFATIMLVHCASMDEFLVYLSFLFPFYCDELTTMAVRIKNGDNLLKAHRKHLYQVLVNERGNSHLKVTISYAMVQAVSGLAMIYLYFWSNTAVLLIALLLFFTLFSLISWCIRRNKQLPFTG